MFAGHHESHHSSLPLLIYSVQEGSDVRVSSHTNIVHAVQCPSYTLLVLVATDCETKAARTVRLWSEMDPTAW